jgi:hypothetical protein
MTRSPREAGVDVALATSKVGELLSSRAGRRRSGALGAQLHAALGLAQRFAIRRREQCDRLGLVADLVADQDRLVVA